MTPEDPRIALINHQKTALEQQNDELTRKLEECGWTLTYPEASALYDRLLDTVDAAVRQSVNNPDRPTSFWAKLRRSTA